MRKPIAEEAPPAQAILPTRPHRETTAVSARRCASSAGLGSTAPVRSSISSAAALGTPSLPVDRLMRLATPPRPPSVRMRAQEAAPARHSLQACYIWSCPSFSAPLDEDTRTVYALYVARSARAVAAVSYRGSIAVVGVRCMRRGNCYVLDILATGAPLDIHID